MNDVLVYIHIIIQQPSNNNILLTFPDFHNVKAIYYKYCNDYYVTNKTYYAKCLIHFESICSSCNIQNYHTDYHTYAVEKQIIGFHLNGTTIHGDWH